jgi:hypothetical protein
MNKDVGQTCEMFAIMEDGKLVMVVAKNPDRPVVIDITDDLARLLHHKLSAPPKSD